MISRDCDFQEFLRRVEGLDFHELQCKVVEEGNETNGMLMRFRTKKERSNSGCQSYYDELHDFAFILNRGQKPAGMTKATAMQVKPIIESLVSQGQLEETVLEMFNQW